MMVLLLSQNSRVFFLNIPVPANFTLEKESSQPILLLPLCMNVDTLQRVIEDNWTNGSAPARKVLYSHSSAGLCIDKWLDQRLTC